MTQLTTSTRLYLPFRSASGLYNAGTVTYADENRFRVTWDYPGRPPRAPRLRTWHKMTEASRFRLGNPGPDTE
jgi:hypothetical protein